MLSETLAILENGENPENTPVKKRKNNRADEIKSRELEFQQEKEKTLEMQRTLKEKLQLLQEPPIYNQIFGYIYK